MGSWRARAATLAKLAVGICLLTYVLTSGMVDFTVLKSVVLHPANFVMGLLFLSLSAVGASLRWFLLVRAQNLTLSIKNLLELTMVGNFFNTFMPGAVGGDVIKAWYVAGREPGKKTRAVFTVLLDRAIGLAVFFFFAAATLAWHFEWLKSRPQLQAVAYGIWAVAVAIVVGAVFFFSPLFEKMGWIQRLLRRLSRNPKVANLIDAGILYRHKPFTIGLAVVVSALSITVSILLYRIQGELIGIPMELSQYFFVIPVALTVSAVPLLPGGIGVGQVAFFTLFQWVGQPNPEQGSTLCTAVQIYTILFNCIGAIFYLRFKRQPTTGSLAKAAK